jgi:hypothetical protein
MTRYITAMMFILLADCKDNQGTNDEEKNATSVTAK